MSTVRLRKYPSLILWILLDLRLSECRSIFEPCTEDSKGAPTLPKQRKIMSITVSDMLNL